ncbi:MAG: endoglucanase H/glycosyl hydrolase family 26 [Bacillota bacterium]|nr:MAG: endoglucanase H/glycosyl hydrolase family 26 [Bacillota bacterium]MBS3950421.1 glycoside hydrolase family 26 [Peptococcaceae bacterium]
MRYVIITFFLLLALLSTGCDRLGITLMPDLAFVKVPSEYAHYYNAAAGYSVKYPSELKIDTSLAAVRTMLLDENTTVEIYLQEGTSSRSYIRYGNSPILSGRDQVDIIKNTDKIINWRRVRELWWRRPALAEVLDDKPYYASVDIAMGFNTTYTLLFKSNNYAELQRIAPPMIRSFRRFMTTAEAEARINLPLAPKRATTLSPQAQELLQNLKIGDKHTWGLFEPSYPFDTVPLHQLEAKLDYTFNYILLYSDFDSGMLDNRLKLTANDNRIPVLTLQTFSPKAGYTVAKTYDLLSGKYDEFLRGYARDVAEFGQPLLFRFNNEMNGDWCAYSAYHSSKDAGLYVESYKYVYRIFAEAGANNALWVWNPHDGSFPDFKWNHSLAYYPGDEYVDVVGLTGYNAGTYYKGEKWRGFKEIYDPLYAKYDVLFPHKALMITEFASNSVGGNKVAWIHEAMTHMKDYPRISVAIWWNHCDYDGKVPSRTYKLDETDETLKAFKLGLEGYR